MVHAFVTIMTTAGSELDVAAAIDEHPGVQATYVVAGDFDVVAEIDGETTRDLLKTVTEGIRDIEGVGTTRTYLCIDDVRDSDR